MKIRTLTLFTTLSLAFLLTSCDKAKAGVSIPDTPDGTVATVSAQLADGNPAILWQALPASYQQDLTEVTHLFGAKMDPELYAKVFDLARKISTVLGDKKELILDVSMLKALEPEQIDRIKMNWDSGLAICTTLFNSEIADLEAVKTLDIQAFLAGTGSRLMADVAAISKNDPKDPYENDFRQKLTSMTVETVSAEGNSATLRMVVPDQDSKEIQLVKVEDRWVPKDLADEWKEKIAEAKEKLNALTEEEMAKKRVQAMMGMSMVETVVDQIAAANTSKELETTLGAIFGGMLGQMGGAMSEPPAAAEPDSE